MDGSKVILSILVIIAITLSIFSILNNSKTDFSECIIKNGVSDNLELTSCDKLCGENECVLALQKNFEKSGGTQSPKKIFWDAKTLYQ